MFIKTSVYNIFEQLFKLMYIYLNIRRAQAYHYTVLHKSLTYSIVLSNIAIIYIVVQAQVQVFIESL